MTRELLARFDREVRRKASVLASAYRTERSDGVRRAFGPFSGMAHNWISHHEFEASEAAAIIETQIDAYEAVGHAFRWKIYDHDTPRELTQMLLDRGFKRSDTSSLLINASEDCLSPRPSGIDYVKIEDPALLPTELKPIADAVWDDGADELIASLAMELEDMGAHEAIYVAKAGGATVGCGILRYDRDFQFGGLFAGSTVPAWRNKGIYRGTVAVRAEDAVSRGAEHLYVEAGPMSRPILERLGFREVSKVSNYVYERGAT